MEIKLTGFLIKFVSHNFLYSRSIFRLLVASFYFYFKVSSLKVLVRNDELHQHNKCLKVRVSSMLMKAQCALVSSIHRLLPYIVILLSYVNYEIRICISFWHGEVANFSSVSTYQKVSIFPTLMTYYLLFISFL